jgi:hypothetical protein
MRTGHLTYAIRSPIRTRRASCEEVNCEAWQNGWQTTIPVEQLETFRAACNGQLDGFKRQPISVDSDTGPMFTFLPGNPCFDAVNHVIQLPAPEFYFVGPGTTRAGFSVKNARQHTKAEDWQEDMQEHLARVKRDEERGLR